MLSGKQNNSNSPARLNQGQTEIILQSLRAGVCQISTDGRVQYANRAVELTLNRTAEELLGKPYSELFFGQVDESYIENVPFCPIRFVLTSGENAHVNSEVFFDKGGVKVQVEYLCVPLIEDGEINGAVISFEEIAERYEAEKALEQGRDMAIEAARTKAAFLANMSHEIRTPLNGIVGTTNLLLDSDLSAEHRKYVKMLKTSGENLKRLVDDVLDFSKFESGSFLLERIEFQIRDIANEICELFSALAVKKQLVLDNRVQEDVASVLTGDIGKVRQILNNFISNAIKFTEKGEIRLKIGLESEDDLTQELRFEVSDTGIGIDHDAQTRLFNPFIQADVSTTRVYGGTGLGLAISRQLVEMMEGKIGLDSSIGEGSSFWFTLRFEKPSEEGISGFDSRDAEDVHLSKPPVIMFPRELRVLIAEDNQINRVVASKMLEQFGISPVNAENGLIAVEKAKTESFDIIFMDCQMPEMDGLDATARIRELDIDQPKIVALTASTSLVERDRCKEAGMDDYLSKPFTKTQLSRVLNDYFGSDVVESNSDSSENNAQNPLASIVDAKKLEKFLEIESNGRGQFTQELLNLYLEHSEKLIAEIHDGFGVGDYNRVKEAAHNLKGSSGNVGITALFDLLDRLEAELNPDNPNTTEEIITRIDSEFNKIRQVILSIK